MNETLKKRVDLFDDNYSKMRDGFRWESASLLTLVSLLYTNEDKPIDPAYIRQSKDIIKQNAGLFSNFRSTTHLAVAAILSLSDNPEAFFLKTQAAYRALKDEKFYASDYLVIAALMIAKEADPARYGEISERAYNLYRRMKEEHPFLTSSSDYTFAVMLAMSGLGADKLMEEAEECFGLLRDNFRSADEIQSLAHILAIGEETASNKCARAIQLYEELKIRKNKFKALKGLSALGVLVLITSDIDKTADDIIAISDKLKNLPGFGIFSVPKDQRLLLSAGLVSNEYVNAMRKNVMSMTLMNSITSILIAQHTAMIVATTSACSAAAAST